MALIVAGSQIVGDPGLYQPWDSTLTSNPIAATQDNKGCAPGWAAIYVQDSVTGETVKVCRRLDEAILGPGGAAIINEETAPNWTDQTVINIAETTEQIVSGAVAVGGALAPTFGTAALLVSALVLLVLMVKK